MNKGINLIFPYQLYARSPLLENYNEVYLIEEYLFSRQRRLIKASWLPKKRKSLLTQPKD